MLDIDTCSEVVVVLENPFPPPLRLSLVFWMISLNISTSSPSNDTPEISLAASIKASSFGSGALSDFGGTTLKKEPATGSSLSSSSFLLLLFSVVMARKEGRESCLLFGGANAELDVNAKTVRPTLATLAWRDGMVRCVAAGVVRLRESSVET